jgi:hypothetical protein
MGGVESRVNPSNDTTETDLDTLIKLRASDDEKFRDVPMKQIELNDGLDQAAGHPCDEVVSTHCRVI